MDEIKEKYQIVVARYNEDISWLLPFKEITIIYNKGDNHNLLNNFTTIQLDNVGRESHTYLYHIINNYEHLADKTIFFQGKIDDHKILEIEDYFGKEEIIGKYDNLEIDKLKHNIQHFGKYKLDYVNGNMKICIFKPFEWLIYILGINLDNIETTKVIWGANFSLSKEIILSKPKFFYENIFRYINYHPNPEEGHILERSWYLIFTRPFILKKHIGYIFVKNNLKKVKKMINNKINYYDEIHYWLPLIANTEYGYENKINCTPNNNKYLIINPKIDNNCFYLKIKGFNDAHIFIEFENQECKYEIVFGAWNNTKSIVRDFYKNMIISSYDKPILNKNEFIKFDIEINDKIIIKSNNIIIFEIKNFYEKTNIKKIKIKSYFNSNVFWDYEDTNEDLNEKGNLKEKNFICNNTYNNIDLYYKFNFLEYYVEKINLLEYI